MLGGIKKKQATPVIDSRFLKILAAKKADLVDALIFVCLEEEKYGHLDKGQLRKIVEMLEKTAPDSVWFGATKDYSLSIIDRKELKNKDLLVKIKYADLSLADPDEVEANVRRAIPEASNVSFIHTDGHMTIESK